MNRRSHGISILVMVAVVGVVYYGHRRSQTVKQVITPLEPPTQSLSLDRGGGSSTSEASVDAIMRALEDTEFRSDHTLEDPLQLSLRFFDQSAQKKPQVEAKVAAIESAVKQLVAKMNVSPEARSASLAEIRALLQLARDKAVTDTSAAIAAASRARTLIIPLVANPFEYDREVWKSSGIAAWILEDVELASVSFEAIARLFPAWRDDKALCAVMTELSKVASSNRVYDLGRNVSPSFDPTAIKVKVNDTSDRTLFVRQWLEAHNDNAAAMREVGKCFRDGRGTIKSHTEGVKWLQRAGVSGDEEAMQLLASLYEKGHGTAAEAVRADKR